MKKLLNGNTIAERELERQREKLSQIGNDSKPSLAIMQVGENPRSKKYIERKESFGKNIGASVHVFSYDKNFSVDDLKREIKVLQKDYSGVMIQLPIPGFSAEETEDVLSSVDIEHDVDCLNSKTLDLCKNKSTELDDGFQPPVAGGVALLLEQAGIDIKNSKLNFVVLGKGKTVGLPVASMLERYGVQYVSLDEHSDPETYKTSLLKADVVISGIGKAHILKPEMVKDGVVLIDAGVDFQGGKLCGDVDPLCYEKAKFYSPVPGGVGPAGIASLFQNLLLMAKKNIEV